MTENQLTTICIPALYFILTLYSFTRRLFLVLAYQRYLFIFTHITSCLISSSLLYKIAGKDNLLLTIKTEQLSQFSTSSFGLFLAPDTGTLTLSLSLSLLGIILCFKRFDWALSHFGPHLLGTFTFLQVIVFTNSFALGISAHILLSLLSALTFCCFFNNEKKLSVLTSFFGWNRFAEVFLLFSLPIIFFTKESQSHGFLLATFFILSFVPKSTLLAGFSCLSKLIESKTIPLTFFYLLSSTLSILVLIMKFPFETSTGIVVIPWALLAYSISIFCSVILYFVSKSNTDKFLSAFISISSFFVIITLITPSALKTLLYPMLFLAFPICLSFTKSLALKVSNTTPAARSYLSYFDVGFWLEQTIFPLIIKTAYLLDKTVLSTIYFFEIQVPAALEGILQILFRLMNIGGAQKAIAFLFLGLIFFLIYFADLEI